MWSRINALKEKINAMKLSRNTEKVKKATIKFSPFSKKQKKVLTWWDESSPVQDADGIIADGAIRSGKTMSMSLSYALWVMKTFNGQNFGMAGKTIGSFRRNVLFWLKLMLKARGFKVEDKRADNLVVVSKRDVTNYFYIFGGKDERSQDLIQGITLAAMFFDEVVLMPQSFVNQAIARCSVEGSKWWFNCNPEGPHHWFKVEFIDKAEEKNILYIHFTMDDNLSLSEKMKQRYRKSFSGVFFDRYIRGLWVIAEGVIYSMFNKEQHIINPREFDYINYTVSVDYGTQNPTVFGLWGETSESKHIMLKEFYHSGRDTGQQKTDSEYADEMDNFTKKYKIKEVVVDPSAASFIAELRKRGYKVRKAKNDVLDGIRLVGSLLNNGYLFIGRKCTETIKEFSLYAWDEKASQRGEDTPIKNEDHSMDQMRYYANTIIKHKNIKIKHRKAVN